MADVPLGMFLSGGIDSSAIAAVMSGMVDEPIKTFSVAFAEREANELEYARIVAEAYKTNHHEIVVSPEEFFDALPRLVWHEDEPLAHPSSVALYFVSRLASQHVKVVLTGEGSDELLAGYGRYRKTILNLALGKRYRSLTPSVVRGAVRKRNQGTARRSECDRSSCELSSVSRLTSKASTSTTSRCSRSRCKAICFQTQTLERIGGIDPYAGVRAALEQTDADSLLDRLLYADIKTYLHELLMKQDQMSMATSIESRVPFLDHKLVEFTCSLPETIEAARRDDEVHSAREHERRVAGSDPVALEDGISGSDRRVVPWRVSARSSTSTC